MTVPLQANADALSELARRTATPIELVKDLYEDEVTRLRADATVERYIAVIATKRVRRKLRTRRLAAG